MRARSIGTALALILAYGCGGSKPPVRDASDGKAAKAREAKAPEAPRYLPAHPLLEAHEGTFGPYVGRSGERALAVWAAPTARGHRFMTLPLDASGAPTGPVRDAGLAPDLPPRVVVRPLGDGFVAAFTYRADLSSIVAVLSLSASGEPKGEAVIVTQSIDAVLYADVVSLDGGAVLLYAAQRGEAAEVMAIPIGDDGRPRGSGGLIASDALAWQPLSLGETAALGFVARAKQGAAGGQVALLRFDDKGRLVGKRTLVSEAASADADLDAVRIGDRVALAWTDRGGLDSRLFVATTDLAGEIVTAPHPATTPRGDQALMGLVASAEGTALVAWEELAQQTSGAELPAHARVVRLGILGADGRVRPRTATLALAGDEHGAPEFAATKEGWATTTLAPACARPATCPSSPLVPTVVRFDRDLGVLGSEPLLTEAFGPAALAWGLGCEGSRCTVLAAGEKTPTPVFAMEITPRATGWVPAAKLDRATKAPRAVAWETLIAGERLADLASTKLSGGSLLAWVTYFAEDFASENAGPAASPKEAATVSVRALDERGEAMGEATIISVRAASVGGVALASDAARAGEACLAWVGHDAGQTQVFATRLGKDGKRLGQQMITRGKGGVGDVAIASVADGWILAWIDWRHGNGEVYATKLDRSLKRILPERRITNATGDAFSVELALHGDEVWLAWADARGEGEAADPYTIRLATKDLEPRGAEIRIAATSNRSRAPKLAKLGEDMVLGWIEEPTSTVGATAQGAKLVRLDARGGPLGIPMTVPLQARATSLALDCERDRCRGIASVSAPAGELRIDAFTWDGGASTSPAAQVLKLLGSSSEDVAPKLAGDSLFFAEDGLRGEGRLRRMRIVWE